MPSLIESILQHNRWANLRLLDACAELSEEQLALIGPGATASVGALLTELCTEEADCVAFIQTGQAEPSSLLAAGTFPGIARLRASAEISGEQLVALAAALDGHVEIHGAWRDEPLPLAAAVYVVQAIAGGAERRAQVAMTLRQHGTTVPELDGWAFHEWGGTG